MRILRLLLSMSSYVVYLRFTKLLFCSIKLSRLSFLSLLNFEDFDPLDMLEIILECREWSLNDLLKVPFDIKLLLESLSCISFLPLWYKYLFENAGKLELTLNSMLMLESSFIFGLSIIYTYTSRYCILSYPLCTFLILFLFPVWSDFKEFNFYWSYFIFFDVSFIFGSWLFVWYSLCCDFICWLLM